VLPPEAVIRAAGRWIRLLAGSPVDEAAAILRASAQYADLTSTQYAAGLDWLRGLGLVTEAGELAKSAPRSRLGEEIMVSALTVDPPGWLSDAVGLVPGPDLLPVDVEVMAEALEVTPLNAWLAVQGASRKVDVQIRATVGAAGEARLVELLRDRYPFGVEHLSLYDDTYGYDVLVLPTPQQELHLEVKSTTRPGDLRLHMSRHELNVASQDSCWRLVVVGLSRELQLRGLGTVAKEWLLAHVPENRSAVASWESVEYRVPPGAVHPGIALFGEEELSVMPLHGEYPGFAWLPQSGPSHSSE
jgi:hypothetical protein